MSERWIVAAAAAAAAEGAVAMESNGMDGIEDEVMKCNLIGAIEVGIGGWPDCVVGFLRWQQ